MACYFRNTAKVSQTKFGQHQISIFKVRWPVRVGSGRRDVGAPKGGAPPWREESKGGARRVPNPEKVGLRRVGSRRVEGPKFRALFASPAPSFVLFVALGVFS